MLIHGKDIPLTGVIESWVGILGSLAVVLTAIIGGLIWISAHFESSSDAARSAAWTAKALADQQVLALRNRVNDCAIRREQPPPMSPLERAACKQYDDEFSAATASAQQAFEYAKAISR